MSKAIGIVRLKENECLLDHYTQHFQRVDSSAHLPGSDGQFQCLHALPCEPYYAGAEEDASMVHSGVLATLFLWAY